MKGRNLNLKALGQNIRYYRIRCSFTQKELAQKVHRTHQYISRLESGESGMSVETFIRLCQALMCSPADLLNGAE